MAQQKDQFDLIIIGGGIQGAALLWEASHRGLKTLLLEKNDFGSAASANSLKTIHGGIRYLQRLDFKRIWESSSERATLLRIAPHLITPLSCLMPSVPGLKKSRLALTVGAKLYNALSHQTLGEPEQDPGRVPAARFIRPKQLSLLAPPLYASNQQDSHTPKGALHWFDAQVTNSERLVLAFIQTAQRLGAIAHNYHQVTALLSDKKQHGRNVTGVIANNPDKNQHLHYFANTVIDCSSSWQLSQQLIATQHNSNASNIATSINTNIKAVNLVLDLQLCSSALALQANSSQQRMVFLSPWLGKTLAGTWYFPFTGDADNLMLSDAELTHCIQQLHSALASNGIDLKSAALKQKIIDIHQGLLPGDNKSTDQQQDPESQLIQKLQLVDFAKQGINGLYFLQGNKYTTARANAERALTQLADRFNLPLTNSLSSELPLFGAPSRTDSSAPHHSAPAQQLHQRYGEIARLLEQQIQQAPQLGLLLPGTKDIYQVEVRYCTLNEQVIKLDDLLYRRLDLGTRGPIKPITINWCANYVGQLLGWDQAEIDANIEHVTQIEQQRLNVQHKKGSR